jgi:hypothetical protein
MLSGVQKPRYRSREIQPGAGVQADDEIDAFIRAKVKARITRRVLARWAIRRTQWRWSAFR